MKVYRTTREEFLDGIYQEYKNTACSECGSTRPKHLVPGTGGVGVYCDDCGEFIDAVETGRDGQ